ncbi:hypothetical protein [Roseovarius rhodophyticola]|uniref:Uncharacterized protein n=1 Tax=Roseovarius rhodophyticola TaxID=3080827 RepID=A0ABZ2TFC9_9RHOB|nr:hypothetical protein [Roseovarius sp. W115]MDV2928065.1 hypothetical protein [Roseovarius sp. W115]
MTVSPEAPQERKIKRPVVSDEDGTREGGLVFPIVFIIGFMLAAMAHPAALASFWVWFVLLMLSSAVAVATKNLVARLNGFEGDAEDDVKGPL